MSVGDAHPANVYNERRQSRFEVLDRTRNRSAGECLPPPGGGHLNAHTDEVRHVMFTAGAGGLAAWVAATLLDRAAGRRIRASVAGAHSDAVLAEAARVLQAFDRPTAIVPAHLTLDWDGEPDLVVVIGGQVDPGTGTGIRTWPLPEIDPASGRAAFTALADRVHALAVELSVNPCCRAATP